MKGRPSKFDNPSTLNWLAIYGVTKTQSISDIKVVHTESRPNHHRYKECSDSLNHLLIHINIKSIIDFIGLYGILKPFNNASSSLKQCKYEGTISSNQNLSVISDINFFFLIMIIVVQDSILHSILLGHFHY